jgi:hypothetical protein
MWLVVLIREGLEVAPTMALQSSERTTYWQKK